jgi:hypothetical protein
MYFSQKEENSLLNLNLNRLCSVLLTIFCISLLLTVGLITGCGDEGESVTEMVNGDDDMTDGDEEPVPEPETPVVEPPVEEPEVATVSYSDNIEPILNERCAFAGCHVAGHVTNLDLSSYDTFKKGGNNDAAFVADDGEGSLVVKRIDGSQPPQMPPGGPPLDQDQIQLFIDWINEGAENN